MYFTDLKSGSLRLAPEIFGSDRLSAFLDGGAPIGPEVLFLDPDFVLAPEKLLAIRDHARVHREEKGISVGVLALKQGCGPFCRLLKKLPRGEELTP